MEKPEDILELFDQYLNNTLDSDAKKAVENRLATDENFRLEFEQFQTLTGAFQDAEVVDFNQKLSDWDKEETSEKPEEEKKSARIIPLKSLAVAASIAIITFFGIRIFFDNGGNESFVTEHFTAYNNVVTVRGVKEDIDEALVFYDAAEYSKAAELLNPYTENTTALFYLGESQMALGEYQAAEETYQKVLGASSVFTEVAEFHLALALLGQDQPEKAKSQLESIQKTSDYYKEAQEILGDL